MTEFNHDAIQAAYHDLGYRYGWTFMMNPERTMREADVAFIGLNPGGGGEKDEWAHEGVWAVPSGNAYYGAWSPGESKTSIQIQIEHWHNELSLKSDESFCAQFVPFRSPSWRDLERKEDALAFSMRLWKWTLENSRARLLVTMGKVPGRYLSNLLNAAHVAQFQAGWGKQMIDVYEGSGYRIVAMPHPSRFQLLGRGSKSEVSQTSFRLATN